MRKLHFSSLIAACMIISALLCGCSDEVSEEAKLLNGTVSFSVKDMPKEFLELSKTEKDHFTVKIKCAMTQNANGGSAVRSTKTKIVLNRKNNYSVTKYLTPGQYTIEDYYVINRYAKSIKIENDLIGQTFSAEAGKPTDINLDMEVLDLKNKATEQILQAPDFSHLIQIKDKVYEIEKLKESFSFDLDNVSGPSRMVSEELPGLTVFFDGSEQHNINGVSVSSPEYILFGGIRVGMPVEKIANAENGIIGKPAFCKGTPMMKLEYGYTKFVFADSKSSAILETDMTGPVTNVQTITYKF